jgi:allene oxide cyclase-like protein
MNESTVGRLVPTRLLTLGLAVLVAAAVWSLSASATGGPTTITLVEVSVPKNDRPFGDFTFDSAPVAGDEFVSKNALYDHGSRVGHSEILHTFVTGFGPKFTHKATILFVAQVFVPRGTLLVQGYAPVSPNGPSRLTLPIVGGTGAYAGARGFLNVLKVTGSKSTLEFHLQ